MSAKKFKFVSPGVFLSEIDNSQLPKIPGGIGPVVIGRTRRGPALKPVKVNSFQEFVEIFGEPLPGNEGEDPWREGNGLLATSYAPYAAQAYLKADINSPVTVVRLLGVQGDDASEAGLAGWDVESAYGLFAVKRDATAGKTATLLAIIYGTPASPNQIKVGVKGTNWAGNGSVTSKADSTGTAETEPVRITNDSFSIVIESGATTIEKEVSFREGSKYIRDKLNTNPTATSVVASPPAGSLAGDYWLGETFEETYEELKISAGNDGLVVFAAKLDANMTDFKSSNHQLSPAQSGWVFPQHVDSPGSYDPANLERLFRVVAVQEGEQGMDLHVTIENIKIAPNGAPSPYGTFDVVVKQRRGGRIYVVDSYENLNLNPNSDNFIARRIGDQYFEWDTASKRNKIYGSYPNKSSYIRVQMNPDVGENGPDNPRSVPFGFFGPVIPKVDAAAVNNSKATLTGWVDGVIDITGMTALSCAWPTTPHVTKGSQGIDLVARYIMGGTPYNKKQGTEMESFTSVNRGMRDYLRRYSSYGHLTDQIDGIADDVTTVHAYKFSLDEIVLTGAEAAGADLSEYVPTSVEFIAGSQVGTLAVAAHAGAAAETVIKANDADDWANYKAGISGQGFTLVDFEGNSVPFVFDDAIDHTDGREVMDSGVSKVVIGISGDGNLAALETSIITTINAVNGGDLPGGVGGFKRNIKILAANLGGAPANEIHVKLSQESADATHENGNKSLSIDAGLAAGAIVGADDAAFVVIQTADGVTNNAFKGGINKTDEVAGVSGTAYTSTAAGTARELMSIVNSFSMPLAGGFDGVDITEADPFNMRVVNSTSTTRNNYAYASIDRAIELIKDPEALEMNLAAMPGITRESLTTKLVQTCEARADALAIIDLPDVYIPPFEQKCPTFKHRVNNTNPEKSAKALTGRQINSSYGAAYYPWVKVRDTINSRDLWVPPSVVALGVMGYTEQRDEVWFAPAGFNRGGLNEGNAGLPVLQASEQLLSSQRDKLYDANINPIASFVSEGLVVFGQKTLQLTPSALDRVNVRRLLIFVKKEISRIANNLLFDQNVPATWNRFTGQVVPFLESVKTRLGLTDFKVVLDKTTTTPDLVDRNIMYAKIFLKPARAIEFIAVDFVITRTGASFDD